MRYFRDLGIDAHLLLWRNDGIGSNSHFIPENDTWKIDKWIPYIHKLNIDNSYYSLIGNPKRLTPPPSKENLCSLFNGYDVYIGSGLSPAILNRCGIDIDIFYPYGTGVEYVGDRPTRAILKNGSVMKRVILGYVRSKQIKAIRRSRFCINAEMSLTKQTFDEIGKEFIPLAIPMVYNKEIMTECSETANLQNIKRKLIYYNFKIMSHASHTWIWNKIFSLAEWDKRSKNNDWLIHGFAKFLRKVSDCRPLLLLFEYGVDVDASKRLCADLGIENHVMWLPKMSRKSIMYLLNYCDIGVGEFKIENGYIWGGTGWEVLASGRPLLQSFNFSIDQYLTIFGHKPPPILDVHSSNDVSLHLMDMYKCKEKMHFIGTQSRIWFDKYNGIGLAGKWLDIIRS
jgi:glycosyltransferase involved in cell wall biosynthesis